MIRVGDITKTTGYKAYPYMITILEIHPCGTKARCLWTDSDGCAYQDYDLEILRHTSAKEVFEDVVQFYHIEEPSGMEFYSQKFIDWLRAKSKEYEDFRDKTMEECEKKGMDITDLDSNDLWDFDQAAEKSGWFLEIADMIEREIKAMKAANPTITVTVPEMNGKFIANPSMDDNYPGIDVEFVPDEDKGYLSNPRVLFETHDGILENRNLHVHLWTDRNIEDYTVKTTFDI